MLLYLSALSAFKYFASVSGLVSFSVTSIRLLLSLSAAVPRVHSAGIRLFPCTLHMQRLCSGCQDSYVRSSALSII